jgi:hypothetical protein
MKALIFPHKHVAVSLISEQGTAQQSVRLSCNLDKLVYNYVDIILGIRRQSLANDNGKKITHCHIIFLCRVTVVNMITLL